jgi:UDP-GlcNAc:undecaprenyl-phosphate GlcNAc-1-phosphate transferase
MILLLIGLCFASFLITVCAIPGVRRLAIAREFVDRPGEDRHHKRVTPLGGGIALHGAIAVVILLVLLGAWALRALDAMPELAPEVITRHLDGVGKRTLQALGLILGALVLHAVGLWDDVRGLKPQSKLAVEFFVAGVVVFIFEVKAVAFLPFRLGDVASVLWIVLITNALNLLDNADGLSGGVAAIIALLLVVGGLLSGQAFVPAVGSLIVGACLGFLVYNFPPARIFMGDAGSLVLGYWLGTLSLLTTYRKDEDGDNPLGVLTPLVILAVPLYDVVSVVLIRLKERRPIWEGDRRHFSHRLIARGLSPRQAVMTIYLATAAAGAGGLMISSLNSWQTKLVGIQTLLILLMIALLESGPTNGSDES